MAHHHRHHATHPRHHLHEKSAPHLTVHERGSANEIAGYLTNLAAAIRDGGVQIRAGDRAVGLRLATHLGFDLYAEASAHGANQIALSITWRAPAASDAQPAPALHIASLPPAHSSGQRASGDEDQPIPAEGDAPQQGAGFGD